MKAYRILAYLIAAEVLVQAARMAAVMVETPPAPSFPRQLGTPDRSGRPTSTRCPTAQGVVSSCQGEESDGVTAAAPGRSP